MLILNLYGLTKEILYTKNANNRTSEECRKIVIWECRKKTYVEWTEPEFYVLLPNNEDINFDVKVINNDESKTITKYTIPYYDLIIYNAIDKIVNFGDVIKITCEYYCEFTKAGVISYIFNNITKFDIDKLTIILSDFQINDNELFMEVPFVLYDGLVGAQNFNVKVNNAGMFDKNGNKLYSFL